MSCPRCGYCPECGRSNPASPWVTYPLCQRCGTYHNQWAACPYNFYYYQPMQGTSTFQAQLNALAQKKEEEK